MDIVVPLTAKGFTQPVHETEEDNYFKRFVQLLLNQFDNSFYDRLTFSFLLDTEKTPLGITNKSVEDGVDLEYEDPDGDIFAGTQTVFSEYLSELQNEYKSCPSQYMFIWTPDKYLSGMALAAAYVYSYYALVTDSSVSNFAVDFCWTDNELTDIIHILKYIDTSDGMNETRYLASFFGKDTWKKIFRIPITGSYQKFLYTSEATKNSNQTFAGEFAYFDFTKSNLIENWYAGIGCTNIKIDYNDNMQRFLKADFSFRDGSDTCDFIHVCEYPENMVYTPYIKIKLNISDTSKMSLYEVRFTLDGNHSKHESTAIVSGNKSTELLIDASKFTKSSAVNSIRISVRSLDGAVDACSLWIGEIVGCSNAYSSTYLAELIKNERDRVRNPDNSDQDKTTIGKMTLAVGIVVTVGAIGIGLFVAFRRDDKHDEDNSSELTD